MPPVRRIELAGGEARLTCQPGMAVLHHKVRRLEFPSDFFISFFLRGELEFSTLFIVPSSRRSGPAALASLDANTYRVRKRRCVSFRLRQRLRPQRIRTASSAVNRCFRCKGSQIGKRSRRSRSIHRNVRQHITECVTGCGPSGMDKLPSPDEKSGRQIGPRRQSK